MECSNYFKPELLAPAGDMEKLKTALLYGADAAYLSGQKFSLRSSSDNFTNEELIIAVKLAHGLGRKIYVTLNAFFHDEDFNDLAEFIKLLTSIKVDAVIVADMGVISYIRKISPINIHLSTQASCVNSCSAKLWRNFGVSRVILGRECSIEDAKKIREFAGTEVEIFVHGAMCMAYSGRCTISNFTAGRDSNRGGCIQSCRFEYNQINDKGDIASSHFMSSKDLNGIDSIVEILKSGIHSLKIEGRMKSLLYVATTTKTYRTAIDAFLEGKWNTELKDTLQKELTELPHREYTSAFLEGKLDENSVYIDNNHDTRAGDKRFCGKVIKVAEDKMLLSLTQPQKAETDCEIIPFNKSSNIKFTLKNMRTIRGQSIHQAHQGQLVWCSSIAGARAGQIIRG
jgi:U32 family peptidase